jgi:multidrug efflux system membrane fusion protein
MAAGAERRTVDCQTVAVGSRGGSKPARPESCAYPHPRIGVIGLEVPGGRNCIAGAAFTVPAASVASGPPPADLGSSMDHETDPLFGPEPARRENEPARREKRRISKRSTTIVLAAIALAALFAWWLGKNAQSHAAGQNRRRPSTTVSMAVAKRGDVPVYIEALGTVTPVSTATVRALVAGNLQQVNFQEGQMVRAGQVLVQIDPRPYQLALQQAQGQLLRDQAQLQNAQLTLTRYRTLLAQDSIARQDVDTQAATVKQLQGTVATDQAAVGSARLNLNYTRITAPVSGRIGLRKVDVGNYVSAGDATGVAVITVVSPIDVVFSLPEVQVGPVTARQRTGEPIPVTALDRTRTTALGQGNFLTLDNQVDITTGTVKAKARFANADGGLFPNQFVNIRVLISSVQNALVLPAAAVRHGPKGDFVYVVDDQRTAHMRMVKLGPSQGETLSVVSGLNEGEKVVTEGGDRLQDGGKVTLPGQRPAGGFGQRGQKKGGGLFGWLFGGGKKAADGEQASAAGGAGSGAAGASQRMARLEQELNLDAGQKAKAEAIFAQVRKQAMAEAGDDPDARRAAMRKSNATAFAQLEPILRPDQKAKLAQVRERMSQGGGNRGGGGGGGEGQGG